MGYGRQALAGVALFGLLASGAAAADLDYGYDWSGFYGGVNVGLLSLNPHQSAANLVQPKSTGVLGGFQAGYNYQYNNLVFGLEGDFDLASNSKKKTCANPTWTCNAGADWMSSIRARAGFAQDRFFVYGTGGVAFLRYSGYTMNAAGTKFKDSKTLTGWTAGGGFDYAVTDSVIAGVQLRYSRFKKAQMTYDPLSVPYGVKPSTFSAVVTFSYKF